MALSPIDKLNHLLQSFSEFYPEAGLVLLFVLLIVLDLIFHKRLRQLTGGVALLGFGGILFLLTDQWNPATTANQTLFLGLLHTNNLLIFIKCLFQVLGILTILFAWIEKSDYTRRGEFFSILVAMLLGLHLMVMSANLLMLYLSIELVSIGSYVLTYFSENRKSAEGSLRYILFGAMSSGVMLYGMSWLYGLTGLLHFLEPAFWEALSTQPVLIVHTAFILTLGGLLFKISAVPFHVWAPDVYESAPIAVVAFFSVAPKVAALIVLLTLSQSGAGKWAGFQSLLAVISLASLTVGNFAALVQRNARRMMAYSSIAHAGFLLIGVLAGSLFATQSFLFYTVVYTCMNLAAFLLLHWLERATQSSKMTDYQGLGSKVPWLGVAMVVVMIALAGLPPTAGFTAKLLVFSSLWESCQQSGNPWLLALFGWGLLNVVISVFYYLRIPYLLFFRKSEATAYSFYIHWTEILVMVGVLAPVLILFFKSDLLSESLFFLLR